MLGGVKYTFNYNEWNEEVMNELLKGEIPEVVLKLNEEID